MYRKTQVNKLIPPTPKYHLKQKVYVVSMKYEPCSYCNHHNWTKAYTVKGPFPIIAIVANIDDYAARGLQDAMGCKIGHYTTYRMGVKNNNSDELEPMVFNVANGISEEDLTELNLYTTIKSAQAACDKLNKEINNV